jgi:hypothetical protein
MDGTETSVSAQASEPESIFKWETLKEIRACTLNYKSRVPGRACEVQLTSGRMVEVWRADDGQSYFCHGLTFGGKDAPGGPVSPFSGEDVNTILQNHYLLIDPESAACPGDIFVWRGPGDDTPHSAVLLEPIVAPGGSRLDYTSKLRTKNGIKPETTMTLEQLIADYYGETYVVYRRK